MTSEKKKKTGKTTEKTTGKTAGKTVGKTVDKAAGKAPAATKAAGKAASKAVDKAAGKAAPSAKGGKSSPPVPAVDWQAFIEKMEKTLTDSKAELIDTLIANNKDFKEIVEGMDPKDFADSASDDVDRKMIEALGSQELKRLKLIDSALTRIKQGKYGYCIKCEKRIPPDRLEVLPYALMCIECKSEEERRNR